MKKKEKLIKNVALYLRVSSEKQAKTGDSLREQLDTLQEYVKNRDDFLIYNTYVDDGISGQKLNRDEFTHLMEDVKNGNIDVILFTKLDRWFRSLRHYLNTQEILENNGVTWTAVSQAFFDTTTAHGRAFVAQSMTWAELEAQNDSERILSVFNNKVKNGEVISGSTPYGYSIVDKRLVPNEDSKYVLEIFERYKLSSNITDVMMYMRNNYGIYKTQPTYRKSILTNTIYIGEYRGNKNYCDPIISNESFEMVQKLLSKNLRSNKKYDYIFGGIIRCGECGGAYTCYQIKNVGHPRLDGTRKTYNRSAYRCKKHFDSKICINKKILLETTLEKYLLSNLKTEINLLITSLRPEQAEKVNYDTKIKQVKKKIEKLKELYVNDMITLDEFKIDKAKYNGQIESLKYVSANDNRDISELEKILEIDLESIYSELNIEEKGQFWRNIIEEIRFYADRKIEIFFW